MFSYTSPSPTRSESFVVGVKILVQQRFEISALGVMSVHSIVSPVSVGLWSSSHSLLGSVVVTASNSQLIGGYAYVFLSSSITLTSNSQYYIAATMGTNPFLDSGSDTPICFSSTQFTIIQNVYAAGSDLTFPGSDGQLTLGRWCPASGLINCK